MTAWPAASPRRCPALAARSRWSLLAWFALGLVSRLALVKVRHVQVSGRQQQPRRAGDPARSCARRRTGMTTLHVRHGGARAGGLGLSDRALGVGVGRLPEHAPHRGARIRRRSRALTGPAARAVAGGLRRHAAAARSRRRRCRPSPSKAAARADGFESHRVRMLVRVLAAAPPPLRPLLERAYLTATSGIVVAMRDGPDLEFGHARAARGQVGGGHPRAGGAVRRGAQTHRRAPAGAAGRPSGFAKRRRRQNPQL